jgi:hypothetical protein
MNNLIVSEFARFLIAIYDAEGKLITIDNFQVSEQHADQVAQITMRRYQNAHAADLYQKVREVGPK